MNFGISPVKTLKPYIYQCFLFLHSTKYVFFEIDSNDVIVALDQIDDAKSTATDKVQPIDSTKLTGANAIIIKSGDSKGSKVDVMSVAQVSYVAEGIDEGAVVPATVWKNTGDKITLAAAPAKANYVFKGWSDGKEDSALLAAGAEYEIKAPVTFTAVYEEEVVAPAGPTVTFMNGGTEAYATAVAVDGKVTLPESPTLEAESGYSIASYKFANWVIIKTVDGVETITDVTADTVFNEDTTVYAKYGCYCSNGKIAVYGDINGDGAVNGSDRSDIHSFVKSRGKSSYNYVNKALSPLVGIVGGDINDSNSVNGSDRSDIHSFVKSRGKSVYNNVAKAIYYINK